MGFDIGRAFKAVVTHGLSEVYESNKGGIDRFLGKDDRDEAERLAAQAEEQRLSAQEQEARALDIQAERRVAETNFLNSENERYNSIYAPIEQQLSDKLSQGPNTEEAAGIAGGGFANEFDAATAARSRSEQQAGINYRAGSSTSRMQGENDAYNRARGIAGAQTTARREEDDAQFLQANAFYNANGSGIKERLQSGLTSMYGADYNAAITQSQLSNANADQNQAFSSQLNEQSYDGVTSLVNLGTRAVSAYATGGASEAVPTTTPFTGAGSITPDSSSFSNRNLYLGNQPTGQSNGVYGGMAAQVQQGINGV